MAGRKPGTPKTGGRQKGTTNKVTALAKDAIAAAADRLGGVDRLVDGCARTAATSASSGVRFIPSCCRFRWQAILTLPFVSKLIVEWQPSSE